MIRTSTPTMTESATAPSVSKSKMNGAAMNRIAARYSTTPCTNAGIGPCLNTPLKLPEEHGGSLVEPRVEQLRLGQRLVEGHELDLGAAQGHHLPEVPLVGGVDRGDAEARAEHTVVGERRAAALDVTEDRHARLEAGALLDLALEVDGDSAEPNVAEGVRPAAELGLHVTVLRRGALGDHDDRERVPVVVAIADPLAYL